MLDRLLQVIQFCLCLAWILMLDRLLQVIHSVSFSFKMVNKEINKMSTHKLATFMAKKGDAFNKELCHYHLKQIA
jgi:hypothetical protein